MTTTCNSVQQQNKRKLKEKLKVIPRKVNKKSLTPWKPKQNKAFI